jgi:uncharacterized membrane protein
MSFCESCGKPKKPEDGFCPACGASSIPGIMTRANVEAGSQVASMTTPSTSFRLDSKLAGALAYAFGVISGVAFLVLEPHNRDRSVRFHAFQSIFFNIAIVIFWVVWGTGVALFEAITGGFLLWLIIPIDLTLTLFILGVWIFLMVKAYAGTNWKLPMIGNFAERQASK